MLWIPINQTVYHDIIPQNNPHSFTCASIPSRPSTINKVTRNKEICEGGAFRTALRFFGKMWRKKYVQKNSVFLLAIFFVFSGCFFCWGDSGWSGFWCFSIGCCFLLKGGNPKNVCFKKDLHLDAMFIFFRALNKEQATTDNHVWDVEMLCWGGNFKTVECSRVKREDLSTIFGKGIRNGFCQLDEDSQIIFPWKEMMEITLSIHLHP